MAEGYIKNKNIWNPINNTYVRHNGVWKKIHKQSIKESGIWKEISDFTSDTFLLEIGSTSSTTYDSCSTTRTAHVTFDRDSNILIGVANYYYDATRDKIALISKWNSNGEFIWEQAFDTTQNSDTCLIDTDSDNNVYFMTREDAYPRMYKLSKTDGSIIWQRYYNSVNATYYFGITGNDDVVIGGYTGYNCAGANRGRTVFKKISTSDGSITANNGLAPGNCAWSGVSVLWHFTTDGTDFYGGGNGGYTNNPNIGQGVFGCATKVSSNGTLAQLSAGSNTAGVNYSYFPTCIHGNMTSLTNRTPSTVGYTAVGLLYNYPYGSVFTLHFINSTLAQVSNGYYRFSDSDRASGYSNNPIFTDDGITYRNGIVYCAVVSTKNIINIFALGSDGTILWNNKLEGVTSGSTTYELSLSEVGKDNVTCRLNYHDGRIVLVTVSSNSTSAIDGNFSGKVVQVWKLPAQQMTDTITFGNGSYEYKSSSAITKITGLNTWSFPYAFPGAVSAGYGTDSENARSTLDPNLEYYRYFNS